MSTITLEEAQANLSKIIGGLKAGEEVAITAAGQVVARLIREQAVWKRPDFGLCKGMMTILADDDEHLRDFAEYMP
jgi:antitoxin (DNA-binding transcriptional repressor) of toxin-antitoxin stability system